MNVGTEMILEVYGRQKLMVQTECHNIKCHKSDSDQALKISPILKDNSSISNNSSCTEPNCLAKAFCNGGD